MLRISHSFHGPLVDVSKDSDVLRVIGEELGVLLGVFFGRVESELRSMGHRAVLFVAEIQNTIESALKKLTKYTVAN